ncbi:MAG: DUF2306 domain-containing protein [Pseudomonadaceae bacterium]|nr:DUF2306 domain-containing protein [Pseudomonadaceae bacterium]
MKSISRPEKILFLGLVIYSFIPAIGGLFRILELAGGPPLGLPENPRALTAPVIIGLHILSSAVFCIAGAVQFLPSLRLHYASAHRSLGRVVAAAGCLSPATGLWMTHCFSFSVELQGALLYGVRVLLSLFMIGLIAWAVKAIRNRNRYQHSASMLRAYAIGLGASTQTFVGIGWMIFAGFEPQGLLRDGLMVFSWAINLLAAEWLIHKFLRRTGFPDVSRVRSNPLVQH